jgi:hypothetical protein|tara:strand:+ start:13253 stop:13486 length:234 start_codon:yes stop_codon:yes gene_type:complete
MEADAVRVVAARAITAVSDFNFIRNSPKNVVWRTEIRQNVLASNTNRHAIFEYRYTAPSIFQKYDNPGVKLTLSINK